MSVTSASENIKFINSDQLLARVKRELRTFNQMGIVDPNDFYEYAMDVLENLGMGVMLEKQGIIHVENNHFRIPNGFKYLYSANKCNVESTTSGGISNDIHPQNGYVFYTDTLYEPTINKKVVCDGTKITVREYVEGVEDIHNFRLGTKLELLRSTIDNNLKNPNGLILDGEDGYTGFEIGDIHLKYYSSPIDDDTGLPLIPDSNKIQRAIEYYVISKMMLSWYLNDEVPNITQKAAEMDKKYREAFGIAMNERKTPSFATLVDYAKRQRNKFETFRSLEYSSRFNGYTNYRNI